MANSKQLTPTAVDVDLIIEARWIATMAADFAVLEHHAVVVNAGLIVALLPSAEAKRYFNAAEQLNLGEQVLMPGLINAHTHAAMSLMRGMADDVALMPWLEEHIWPAEQALLSPQFVQDGSLLACAEMLRGGVTCFNDMYFYPQATAAAASQARAETAP